MSATELVRMKVSLAVQVMDGFTARPITGAGCRLRIAGAGPPLVRREGYRVFVNLPEGEWTLHIESPCYYPKTLTVKPGELEPGSPVIKVRMMPDSTYPVPPGATGVRGRAGAGRLVQLVCRDKGGHYKLLLEYDRPGLSHSIAIYNPDGLDLDGRRFLIEDREGVKREYFTILHTAAGEDKCSRMDRALEHSYKKIGARVTPVYTTRADQYGNFFLIFPQGERAGGEYDVSEEGPGGRRTPVILEAGRINDIQLKEV